MGTSAGNSDGITAQLQPEVSCLKKKGPKCSKGRGTSHPREQELGYLLAGCVPFPTDLPRRHEPLGVT